LRIDAGLVYSMLPTRAEIDLKNSVRLLAAAVHTGHAWGSLHSVNR
jgi:hypothetical protein